MQRRKFLTGAAAGAVGWVAGGARPEYAGADHPGIGRAYAEPVPFIPAEDAAALRGALVVDPTAAPATVQATFPQSVASGDPNPHGAVIWTRVDPGALPPGGRVGWQVASSPHFEAGSILLEGCARARADTDYTVKLPLQNSALRPFTHYYYRFIARGVSSRTGRFKTLPAQASAPSALKLGYVVCQDYSNGFYNAYQYLAQEDVDYVVFLGDYIYEYLSDGKGGPNNGSVRTVPPFPGGGQYPQGLADYRHLYKVYRGDAKLQAAHERFAFILLWDDHEFFNDSHQDFHEDTNPPGVTATTPQPALRRAATQGWYEFQPAAVPYDPSKGWEDEIRVYRSFRFGTLTDLVVTDERLYRDGPPCGDVEIGQRYLTPGCAAQSDPARTMLGAEQKRWFLDRVTRSPCRWKLWANEVMLAQYRFGPPLAPASVFFSLDQWDGYPAERAAILGAIKAAGVRNFVALSGDAHLFMASYLKTNYNDLLEAPLGVELMVGAVSSGNYLDAGIDRPAPASPAASSVPKAARRVAAAGLPADSLEPIVLANNPHMVFWNGSTWGYGVITITPDRLVCVFKTPSTVKSQTSTLQTLATFTVPNGQAKLIPS